MTERTANCVGCLAVALVAIMAAGCGTTRRIALTSSADYAPKARAKESALDAVEQSRQAALDAVARAQKSAEADLAAAVASKARADDDAKKVASELAAARSKRKELEEKAIGADLMKRQEDAETLAKQATAAAAEAQRKSAEIAELDVSEADREDARQAAAVATQAALRLVEISGRAATDLAAARSAAFEQSPADAVELAKSEVVVLSAQKQALVAATAAGVADSVVSERTAAKAKADAARADKEGAIQQMRADAGEPLVLKAGSQAQALPKFIKRLDLFSVLSLPVALLYEVGRTVVVEDADPVGGARHETFVAYGDGKHIEPFSNDDVIEVAIDYVAIDTFSQGRLRDSWGGDGGEVSVQVALNALTDGGKLLREDTTFLVEKEVRRRNALFAVLKGNARTKELVEKVEHGIANVLKYVKKAQEVVGEIKAKLKEISDLAADKAAIEKKLAEYRDQLADKVAELIAGDRASDETREMAKSVIDAVVDEIRKHLPELTVGNAQEWAKKLVAIVESHLEPVTAALDVLAKTGVDEQGIYQDARVIVGLADADRLLTVEFENVRPSFLPWGNDSSGGTAAVVLGARKADRGRELPDVQPSFLPDFTDGERERNTESAAHPGMKSGKALIYRGKLSELSTTGGAAGFSLSFLMLERDDDRVVQALRLLQRYADEKGLTIGGGISQVNVSALIDGLAVLAQKIAEDDVELRAIDIRFLNAAPRSGATPGTEVFTLSPCTVLVSRNLDGNVFGAVAQITISKAAD